MKMDVQDTKFADAWKEFKGETWKAKVDVRDFIQQNYTPSSVLSPAFISFLALALITAEKCLKILQYLHFLNAGFTFRAII